MPVAKINETLAKTAKEGHYWSNEIKSWGLVVRPTGTKSWVFQKSGRKRLTLGHYPAMTATEARRGGIDLLDRELSLYLKHWRDRPIASISKEDCDAAHKRLSFSSGEQTADRVLGHVRAVWNTGDRFLEEMDHKNPTDRVDWHGGKSREYPRVDLPLFWAGVDQLQPIVQAWHGVAISTALRLNDLNTMRWENVDLEAQKLHIPEPKGGKAFDLPISWQTAEILSHLPRSSPWVFPSPKSTVGHITNPARRLKQDGKQINAHWLRKEWSTTAAELETPKLYIELMMNHSVPQNSVTDGYLGRISIDRLRPYQQQVSDQLFSADVKLCKQTIKWFCVSAH